MHHYFEAITNTSGDSLVGYFARVIDPATQNTITMSADDNGTPIVTKSGVDNMGSTDDYGNLDFYVVPGTYHLDIYAPNATSFIFRVPSVAMNSSKGDTGAQGPEGPQGEGLEEVMAPGGAALVGLDNGTVKDAFTGRVTPEQFGAVGNARNYPYGFAATDDTAAILAMLSALNIGDSIWLSQMYLWNGWTLQSDGSYLNALPIPDYVSILGPGGFMQPRGRTSVPLAITGSDVQVGGITVQMLNGSFTGMVSGTTLSGVSGLVGTIRYYTVGADNYGSPLYGEGVKPGTRVIGMSGSNYVLDRAQDAPWTGQILFVDVPQFNSNTDAIRIGAAGLAGQEGADVSLKDTVIMGAGGSAVVTVGPRTRGIRPKAYACHDNGYFPAAPEARDYFWDYPVCDGTGRQNGGLATASAGSTATTRFLYGGVWNFPQFSNCGDTPLEIGIHSDGATVNSGRLGPSVAPSLLFRDTRNCRAYGAIECLPQGTPTVDWSPLAVVQQTEPASWNCRLAVDGLRYQGLPGRGFAYIQQSGVSLTDCHGITTASASDGSDLEGEFAILAGGPADVTVKGCSGIGYLRGINVNFGAGAQTIERFVAEDNDFTRVGTYFSGFNTTFKQSRSVGNNVATLKTTGYNLVSAAFTPVSGVPGLIAEDIISSAGFTGATPSMFNPDNIATNGLATAAGTLQFALPETQYAATNIAALTAVANKTMTIVIPGAGEDIKLDITSGGGTTVRRSGSANMFAAEGSTGFAGWAIFVTGGVVIIQRRGANTGTAEGTRTFQWYVR